MAAEGRLSRALLARRRTLIGTYAMRPGEVFPMRIDWPYGHPDTRILDYYAPVSLDAAVHGRDYYRRWMQSFRRIVDALDASERLPWIRKWAGDFRGDRTVLLFYLLHYDVSLRYEVDPRPAMPYAVFRDELRTADATAVFHIFTPKTDVFAESIDEQSQRIDDTELFQALMIKPVCRGLLIIERELAFIVVGGEVIRLGGWLVAWAGETRAVAAAIESTLAFVARFESAASMFAIADRLMTALKAVGRLVLRLLDVVAIHDVLLEIIPALVTLERQVANDLAGLLGLQETGTADIGGWVIEDDPVEQAFSVRIAGLVGSMR